jgi:type I restriction enzyme M protein
LRKFDVIVANPPFSLDKWGAENAARDYFSRFHRGVPPPGKADYAFITHVVETLVDGFGRAAVIVPHGVLFRKGAEGKIRQKLIRENLLEAVIGLPVNLFYGTGIPAAILIFNHGKKTKDVLLIDAGGGYETAKSRNKLRRQDIDRIVAAYQNFETIEKYARRVSFDEIGKNDFNLSIARYLNSSEQEETIDVTSARREIEGLEAQLAEVRTEMKKYLGELGM